MKTKQIKPPSAKHLAAWDYSKGLHPYHAQQAIEQADKELYEQHLKGIFSEGNPNHPMYNDGYNYATGQYVNLFGYSQDELLGKQYHV